jgi:exo-1,4-beta-D-glucosaminidase
MPFLGKTKKKMNINPIISFNYYLYNHFNDNIMKLQLFSLLFISFFCFISCGTETIHHFQKINLTDHWEIWQSVEGKDEIRYPATVPTTVMGALTNAGLYPDIMTGKNMEKIDRTVFNSPWWFKNEFELPDLDENQQITLKFDGISYRANIWLNGTQIADTNEVQGPFRQFSFLVTPYIKKKNTLLVEVFRAQDGEPNIGFVDWNPRPADENTGIFREVAVHVSGAVKMNHTAVQSRVNLESLKEAWLTIETELVNLSDKAVNGKLTGKIDGRNFSYPVRLEAQEIKQIRITSEEINDLHLKNPRLWWCNHLGKPEMYTLNLQFEQDNIVSDSEKIEFGIREISDYFTEEGHRGFLLNGQKVLIKSAGWTDDIFLRNTDLSNEIEIKYVKDMNLNSIRLENIWGKNHSLYDLCDKNGIMILAGWSCQWEWEEYLKGPVDQYGGIRTGEQMDLIAQSFEDQVLWLRNHPSIIGWFVGSDRLPPPALEEKYQEILNRIDDRPYLASAANLKSEITGATGMKMNGPYEYVGPNYWYEDRRFGGAYGFNTETGIGAQLPVLESIRKFIPQNQLWPVNEAWNYHCTASGTALNNLSVLTDVMNRKYGEAHSIEEYVMKAHVIDYEGTKAMFEAFRCHLPQTTGIVQWMLNSAWPSLYWQLYDYYLIPTAGYYGVKKANLPQQLIYNYKENAVYAVNEYVDKPLTGGATLQMYSFNSQLLYEKEIALNVDANTSQKIDTLPPLSGNVFLSLKLKDKKGTDFADNFYWLSADKDKFDWDKTQWIYTPALQYADQKALNEIPAASIQVTVDTNETGKFVFELKNESSGIAFFTQLLIKDEAGAILYPVEWSDNYISLLPEERKSIICSFEEKIIKNKKLSLFISGWNHRTQQVKINR